MSKRKIQNPKGQTPKPQDLPVVITVTVMPLRDGSKRRVLVSGAPDGEMPVVKAGLFGDLHRLIDETWIALLKRKPQVVKKPRTTDSKNRADTEAEAEGIEGTPAHNERGQAEGTQGTEGVPESEPPAELPAIEGDAEPGGETHDADSGTDARNGSEDAEEDERG